MQRLAKVLAVGLMLAVPTIATAANPPPRNAKLPKPIPLDADSGRLKWTERPDLLLLFRLAADYAVETGGDGEVHCVLAENRRPTDCVIVRETPEGRYGTYLIAMAKRYQAASLDSKGQSPVGRKVRFAFRIADRKESLAPPKAR